MANNVIPLLHNKDCMEPASKVDHLFIYRRLDRLSADLFWMVMQESCLPDGNIFEFLGQSEAKELILQDEF